MAAMVRRLLWCFSSRHSMEDIKLRIEDLRHRRAAFEGDAHAIRRALWAARNKITDNARAAGRLVSEGDIARHLAKAHATHLMRLQKIRKMIARLDAEIMGLEDSLDVYAMNEVAASLGPVKQRVADTMQRQNSQIAATAVGASDAVVAAQNRAEELQDQMAGAPDARDEPMLAALQLLREDDTETGGLLEGRFLLDDMGDATDAADDADETATDHDATPARRAMLLL